MSANLIYYLTATVLGGLHALEPGHGKTVVAAYLVGSKGKKIDAILLGLIVTFTHTFSVILMAVAAKALSTRMALTEDSLHGYFGLVAGLMILAVGLWMLTARIRGKEPLHFHSHAQGHDHGHDHNHNHNHNNSHDRDHHSHDHHHHHHDHDHDHHNHNGDTHAHHHEHAVDGHPRGGPREGGVGYWQLFLLGVSGGLVPCPAAIAILLAAIGTGRLGEGLAYILLFSMGLALTLTTIGLVVISAGKLARRMLDAKGLADKAAIASAAIITLIGAITLANSLRHII
jgi:nickel/cobalt exporter